MDTPFAETRAAPAADVADTAERAEAERELARHVQAIDRLETIVAGWDSGPAATVQALKSAIEDLHKETLRRLIRALKDDPDAGARLRGALADPLVWAVLRFHGLVRAPLAERVEAALNEVRPAMAEHGGDVELVAIRPPDTVELRLVGACHGCPASGQTLVDGVERAIRSHCPEITQVLQVSRPAAAKVTGPAAPAEQVVHFVSPFARHGGADGASAADGWSDACALDEIPDGGVLARSLSGRELLLARRSGGVSGFDNACAHLGMPLDLGEVEDGVITCPYHGFQYLLETGECLTAPEVQLEVVEVRVVGARVQVRLDG